MSGADEAGWRPAFALTSAVVVVSAGLLLGVALRRPDLIVVVIPIVVGALFALSDVPALPVIGRLQASSLALLEGESSDVSIRLATADTVDAIRLRVGLGTYLDPGSAPLQICTAPRNGTANVTVRVTSLRWGRSEVGPVVATALTAGGLLRYTTLAPPVGLTTAPLRADFRATQAVPRSRGLSGMHPSRQRGEGTDVAGVREFAPGDRLRRINWRVSGRTGVLHVTDTYTDRDTEVYLVLDSATDLGRSTGIGGGSASTLDVAVRGAASIAEHYLRHGDRVGILDLARPERRVPTRAGRRQLTLITDYLLDTGHGLEHRSVVDRALTSIGDGALVIVLSPLIGPAAAEHALGLARTGRSVLVVDTLSDEVGRPDEDNVTALAWRIVALQRDATVESLRLQGIPVVTWHRSGSLDQVLRELSRAARAPRVRP